MTELDTGIKRFALALGYVGVAVLDFERHRITGLLAFQMTKLLEASDDRALKKLSEADGYGGVSIACLRMRTRQLIAESAERNDRFWASRVIVTSK